MREGQATQEEAHGRTVPRHRAPPAVCCSLPGCVRGRPVLRRVLAALASPGQSPQLTPLRDAHRVPPHPALSESRRHRAHRQRAGDPGRPRQQGQRQLCGQPGADLDHHGVLRPRLPAGTVGGCGPGGRGRVVVIGQVVGVEENVCCTSPSLLASLAPPRLSSPPHDPTSHHTIPPLIPLCRRPLTAAGCARSAPPSAAGPTCPRCWPRRARWRRPCPTCTPTAWWVTGCIGV